MGNDVRRPRIYLAGPEVFFPNAREQGEIKKRLCAEHGFEGVYPLDNEIANGAELSPEALARAISLGNEALMRSSDLIVANDTPFRGVGMDAGTAFEIGFMRALGRPVVGYSNVTADYANRVRSTPDAAQAAWCLESLGADIEDFGLPENLMIAIAVLETAGRFITREVAPEKRLSDLAAFEACLALAREIVSGAR